MELWHSNGSSNSDKNRSAISKQEENRPVEFAGSADAGANQKENKKQKCSPYQRTEETVEYQSNSHASYYQSIGNGPQNTEIEL